MVWEEMWWHDPWMRYGVLPAAEDDLAEKMGEELEEEKCQVYASGRNIDPKSWKLGDSEGKVYEIQGNLGSERRDKFNGSWPERPSHSSMKVARRDNMLVALLEVFDTNG